MKENLINQISQLVKDSYQATAQEFHASRQKEVWPYLRELAYLVPDQASVLDLGCGNGRLLQTFRNRSINYLGCDQDASLLKLAAKSWPGQQFIFSNLPKLNELAGQKFNFIFCIAVWHHIPGKNQRLESLVKMQELLLPGGQIFISVWNLRKQRPLLVYLTWLKRLFYQSVDFGDVFFPWKDSQGRNITTRYHHAFGEREIKKLVKQSGLILEQLNKDKYNYWLILRKKY